MDGDDGESATALEHSSVTLKLGFRGSGGREVITISTSLWITLVCRNRGRVGQLGRLRVRVKKNLRDPLGHGCLSPTLCTTVDNNKLVI